MTLEVQGAAGFVLDKDTRKIGRWRVVVVSNLPFADQRRNGKIPKMLAHRVMPNLRYSIWVDRSVTKILFWQRESECSGCEYLEQMLTKRVKSKVAGEGEPARNETRLLFVARSRCGKTRQAGLLVKCNKVLT